MSNDTNSTDARVVDELGRLFEDLGSSSTTGRIFGALIVSQEPLSLTAIADRLGLSKAVCSTSVRVLHDLGYCRRLPVGSDRQHLYELREDYLVRVFRLRSHRARRALDDLTSAAAVTDGSVAARRISQLRDLQEELLAAQDAVIERWAAHGGNVSDGD